MTGARFVLFSILLVVCSAGDLEFPSGFKFGAATSSYQVEGGWNSSDKGENIWDRWTHVNPDIIVNRSNADVACDSYRLYREDVRIAADLGLHFYRFSINWPRILPLGLGQVSGAGHRYYSDFIDALLTAGVEPFVTMYHLELPQRLQDLGGWTNPLIVDWYANYARILFSLFADRVKMWNTLNEPIMFCDQGYNVGAFAPGVVNVDHAGYLCNKHALLAHAKAWRIYDEEFKPKYGGKVAITNAMIWYEASSKQNQDLTELVHEYSSGRYTHPIYSREGGWPPRIEEIIRKNSKDQGFPRSRLPSFTAKEIETIRGTYDFFALNHYTSREVSHGAPGVALSPFLSGDVPELGARLSLPPRWPMSAHPFIAVHPEGLRHVLNWVKRQYGDMEIIITENGFPTLGSNLNDDDRIQFLRRHMEQILLAIKKDGVRVTGYSVWTLIDSFEWNDGYRTKFGLYEVNFTDPNRSRTARRSARYYANVIKSNSLQVSAPESVKGEL